MLIAYPNKSIFLSFLNNPILTLLHFLGAKIRAHFLVSIWCRLLKCRVFFSHRFSNIVMPVCFAPPLILNTVCSPVEVCTKVKNKLLMSPNLGSDRFLSLHAFFLLLRPEKIVTNSNSAKWTECSETEETFSFIL